MYQVLDENVCVHLVLEVQVSLYILNYIITVKCF